jgi:integrase/recombinase XerD
VETRGAGLDWRQRATRLDIPAQPSAVLDCPKGVPTPPSLDTPVAALEAYYRRCLAADAPLRARLAVLGLAQPDGTCPADLGLSTRRVSEVVGALRPEARRAVRAAWAAAGLLRPDGRESFAGCVMLPLPAWDGSRTCYAGIPSAALGAPGAGPQRRAGVIAAVYRWRTSDDAPTTILCGDPFDALCCRVAGAQDVLLVERRPDEWPDALASDLAHHRTRRLRLLLPGTHAGVALALAVQRLAADRAVPCDVTSLPPGCHIRDLRRLHGAAAIEEVLLRGTLHLPLRVATSTPRGPAPIAVPWAAARGTLADALSDYLRGLQGLGRATTDVRQRARRLDIVRRTLLALGIHETRELSAPLLCELQRLLVVGGGPDTAPRSRDAALRVLEALRLFLRWAVPRGLVPLGVESGLETLRRHAVPLPLVLSASEVGRVLSTVPVHRPGGLRDRAMLELFYATGIRRVELVGLDVADVDAGRGLVRVRRGKGGTTRLVPLGSRAGPWVARYVDTVRLAHVRRADEPALFVSARGRRIGPKAVTARMHACLRAAGIAKPGSCHVLRHTVATLMHEAGADIRDLQALLGHALLTSTQLYTRVSMRRLQEVHAATHPGERGD